MSAALKYISCPVPQLDLLEPIDVQTQVDSFKDIEYLLTSAIQVSKLKKMNAIQTLANL